MFILSVNNEKKNDQYKPEQNEEEPIIVPTSKSEDKKVIVIRQVDNNFVRNKTLTEIESEESLSHKTKEVENYSKI